MKDGLMLILGIILCSVNKIFDKGLLRDDVLSFDIFFIRFLFVLQTPKIFFY